MNPPGLPSVSETIPGSMPARGVVNRSAKPPPDGERSSRVTIYIWAVVMTVGWHLVWLLLPSPVLHPEPTREVDVLPLRYMALTEAADEGVGQVKDILRVKSPGLFAMPREEGFSARFLQTRSSFAPPVNAPGDQGVFLLEPSPASTMDAALSAKQLQMDAKNRFVQLPSPQLEDVVWDADQFPGRESGLFLKWYGIKEPEGYGDLPVYTQSNAVRWEATFWMQVNEKGLVDRFIPEKPSPDRRWDIRAQAWAHILRFEPGPIRTGTMRVNYRPEEGGVE